jgi:NAD(P)-dependent dehydrogenase (short-subunit alcohol dehydrogenase family)
VKALVTGAARGIGVAIAARLAEDGMEVITLDREPGCDLQLDVRSDPLPAVDVDVVVANAGITTTVAPAHRMTADQWDRDIGVNLTGAFRTVQACLPGMRERRYGRIVLISSMAARTGLPGQVAYTASKAGLLGMMRTLAAEGAARGITCNAVLPGLVATENVLALPDAVRAALLATLPTGRMVDPGEVAAAVSFLTSRDAAQLTAQEVAVDGGMTLNAASLAGRREAPD